MSFNESNIKQLVLEYNNLNKEFFRIAELYNEYAHASEKQNEFISHGFMRRLSTLKRCIENIYNICPPDDLKRLESDQRKDLEINIQSFVLNIFGCLDNLAWVWVKENDLELQRMEVSFTKDKFKATLTKPLLDYLNTERHINWLRHIKDFRDALAHRIPLYVPPSALNEDDLARYREIEVEKQQSLEDMDVERYEKLHNEQVALGDFAPVITHSYDEKSPQVLFHAQVFADWNTIIKISELVLNELKSKLSN